MGQENKVAEFQKVCQAGHCGLLWTTLESKTFMVPRQVCGQEQSEDHSSAGDRNVGTIVCVISCESTAISYLQRRSNGVFSIAYIYFCWKRKTLLITCRIECDIHKSLQIPRHCDITDEQTEAKTLLDWSLSYGKLPTQPSLEMNQASSAAGVSPIHKAYTLDRCHVSWP